MSLFTLHQSSINNLSELVLFSGFIFVVYFLSWFIGRILKFLVKKVSWINPDVRNGFFVLITLTQFGVSLSVTILLLINLRVQPEFIISSVAILITAIGVASTGVAANFIGGFYLLTTRPFRVGDFIRTQGLEGIVQEIGINYSRIITLDRTTVKIPNGNLMSSPVMNYRTKRENTENFMLKDLFAPSKYYVIYRKVIELKLDIITPPISIKSVRERVETVCQEFRLVFGTKPSFYLGRHDFRLELHLLIQTTNAYTIFNVWPYFMERLMTTIYQELQEESTQ